MTARVFSALARHALHTPNKTALRSGATCMSYAALASFLSHNATALAGPSRAVAISTRDPLDAALADLALTYAGHASVHVPPFFSPSQQAHLFQTAAIGAVIGHHETHAATLDLIPPKDCPALTAPLDPPVTDARRIIFTSGSSGTPKGVLIGERQLAAALHGLEQAIAPMSKDIHLSLLPMAQLLEQVAGLYLPLLAGAEVHFCPGALSALFGGPMAPVVSALASSRPTTSILVPALLSRLVSDLETGSAQAPDSLRLIAVGGARSAPALLARAKALGLPVHEGYGLSECSSVVALNRPGDARAGTVGRMLDGVSVRIDEGEIVVSGPTVMEGYIGHSPVNGEWRTGDLGRIECGRLIVEGRKDWLIVTPQGRNINPEWVEAALCADPRIPAAGLHLASDEQLEIIAALAAPVKPEQIAALLSDLPLYARPIRVRFVPASHPGLLNPGGGIDRSLLAYLSGALASFPLSHDLKDYVA